MFLEPSWATCAYPSMSTVCQSNVRSCSFQWNCVTPRKNGVGPLSEKGPPNWVPRSRPNQILLSLAFLGPSQILSIASASAAVKQFGVGAAGSQIFALTLNLQLRGSSITPSGTPSAASHAKTADAVA